MRKLPANVAVLVLRKNRFSANLLTRYAAKRR
jgi:hypothetical protein